MLAQLCSAAHGQPGPSAYEVFHAFAMPFVSSSQCMGADQVASYTAACLTICEWLVAALPFGELVPKPEECPGRLRGHLRHCSIDVQQESACCFQGHPEQAGVRPNPSEMPPHEAFCSPTLRE